ncbi:twin-arginine translocase subunit TatC [Acidobacteriota bacterium]
MRGKRLPDSMTFLEHLGDLRKRLFFSFIALIIGVIPAWVFSKDLYNILTIPIYKFLPSEEQLVFLTLTAPFMLYIKVAFLTSLFFISPFIFYQFWLFVAPGLYKKEKKYAIPFVMFTSFFFVAGALFGFFIVFPWAVRFFLNTGSEFSAMITVDKYFSFILRVHLGIAIVFELPTLTFFLARMKIITAKWMIKNFKYAMLVIFIIAAIITPPDPVTQSLLAVPLMALYGLSIVIAMIFGKKKEKKETNPEA